MRFVLPGPEILIKSIKKIKFQNTNTNIGKGYNIHKGIKIIKYTFRPLS